jgi:ribosomal protein S12 methylthiotransferase accessory factor
MSAPAVPAPCAPAAVVKAHRTGTHRAISPEETLARVRPLMPVMGITRIANITGLDCIGIPVTMVCRPNARSLAVSQGKGLDLVAAKVSGLMESVEAYHAEHVLCPVLLATLEELRYTRTVVDVSALPRAPGEPFHAHLSIPWIEGVDLVNGEPVWLPLDVVHLDFTAGARWTRSGFAATSNGLASGNHPLEAIEHGVCEVIERDAMTLWRLLERGAQAATRVDLRTVHDEACGSVLARYAAAGVAVGVWEITSDVGVPAFCCRILDARDEPFRRLGFAEGMGCHPSRPVALLRALTEAAQSRLTLIAGSRDDVLPRQYAELRSPARAERYRAELLEGDARGTRRFDDGPGVEHDTFDADVAWEIGRLRAAGMERVVVVDLTKPELGIPVARTVVPGLEGLAIGSTWTPGARARARMPPA